MTFAHPEIFFALLIIPLIAGIAIFMTKKKNKLWSDFVADRLRKNLITGTSNLPRILSFISLLIAITLIIVALARPQVLGEKEKETSTGHNIMILLDLSRSMDTRDISPSRLEYAKTVIYELLEKLPNERFGVIGFAGAPYLFVPLTTDHEAVRECVQDLDNSSIVTGGSDIADAVKLAVETLRKTGQKNNGLVILSDGEEQAPDLKDTISEIKESDTLTFTIGVGTTQGDYIPNSEYPDGKHRDLEGNAVLSKLQTKNLTDFANKTHGEYITATSAVAIPDMMANFTQSLQAFEQAAGNRVVSEELHQWFSIPAIFFIILSFLLSTSWKKIADPIQAAP